MPKKTAKHLNSAIYQGVVRHRRFDAKNNNKLQREFSYSVFMVYLDLHELDDVFAQSPWWSQSRLNLAYFRRTDYFDRKNTPLYEAVATLVEQQLGAKPKGPIRMLTNLRYFGFIINPITCYYCFDATGEKVETIVAEVTNTPWGQRCHYVLPVDEQQKASLENTQTLAFSKQMHVSPFQPPDLDYRWLSRSPDKKLDLHIDVNQHGNKVLDATMNLKHQAMTPASMRYFVWRYPWMTLKVFGAIYWQALKLLLRKSRFYSNETESDFTVSRKKY